MYSFTFYYEDGSNHLFEHIIKAKYSNGSKAINVSGDELSTHCFPIGRTIYIFSDSANYSINGNQLRFIAVLKEN